MNTDRKKELKRQYKELKKPMGVFIIRCKSDNKCLIQTSNDLRADINGARVRLEGGFHMFGELQKEWNELGADNFTIEVLDELEYDKDLTKTDYSEELNLLKNMWEEKLA